MRPSSAQERHLVRSGFWRCGVSVVLKKSEGAIRIDGAGFDAAIGNSMQRCVSLGWYGEAAKCCWTVQSRVAWRN